MRRRFYEIHLYEPPGSWGLDLPVWLDGSEVNFWPLTRGSRVDPNEYADVVFPIDEFGTELGFNLTTFNMPVVRKSLAEVIDNIASNQIQRIRARIPDALNDYEILVITNSVDCLNTESSEIELWTPEDGRPDKIGKIRGLGDWMINTDRIPEDMHVFRLKGWTVSILVSNTLKKALEEAGCDGITFDAKRT